MREQDAEQDPEGRGPAPESRESSFTGPRVLLGAPKRVRRCQRKQAALGLKSYLKAQGVGFETLEDLQKRGWSRKTVHVRLDWCSMSIYGLDHLYPADRVTEAERSPEVQEEILRALESRGPARKPAGERPGKQDAPETGKTPGAKRGAARGPAAPGQPGAAPAGMGEHGHHRAPPGNVPGHGRLRDQGHASREDGPRLQAAGRKKARPGRKTRRRETESAARRRQVPGGLRKDGLGPPGGRRAPVEPGRTRVNANGNPDKNADRGS